jgi:hypothetical protein
VGEYTVKRVADSPREWSSKQGGTFLSYTVDLEDSEGKLEAGVEWNRKPESRAPEVGDRIAGTVEPGKFSERFRMDYEATKELTGGGSTSSSGGQDYGRRNGGAKSPDQQASIQRQVALKILAPTINSGGLTEQVKATVVEIETFINAASGAGGGADTGTNRAPAPTQAPTHQELHGLLEKAGLNSNASRVVADYALTHMSAEEQDAALEMLGNESRAKAAVQRLSEKAEKHFGSPLPSDNPDDSIPF